MVRPAAACHAGAGRDCPIAERAAIDNVSARLIRELAFLILRNLFL
jgi:hypothetical protein